MLGRQEIFNLLVLGLRFVYGISAKRIISNSAKLISGSWGGGSASVLVWKDNRGGSESQGCRPLSLPCRQPVEVLLLTAFLELDVEN